LQPKLEIHKISFVETVVKNDYDQLVSCSQDVCKGKGGYKVERDAREQEMKREAVDRSDNNGAEANPATNQSISDPNNHPVIGHLLISSPPPPPPSPPLNRSVSHLVVKPYAIHHDRHF